MYNFPKWSDTLKDLAALACSILTNFSPVSQFYTKTGTGLKWVKVCPTILGHYTFQDQKKILNEKMAPWLPSFIFHIRFTESF